MRKALVALAAATLSVSALASSPIDATVGRYMTANHMADLIKQMAPTDMDSTRVAKYSKVISDSMTDAIKQTFTEEELQASIRYAETPEGQSMIIKTPKLYENFQAIMQPRAMQAIQEEGADAPKGSSSATKSTQSSPKTRKK